MACAVSPPTPRHRTIVRAKGLDEQQMALDSLQHCTVKLFGPMDSVLVDDCYDCTFLIGPTTGSVMFRCALARRPMSFLIWSNRTPNTTHRTNDHTTTHRTSAPHEHTASSNAQHKNSKFHIQIRRAREKWNTHSIFFCFRKSPNVLTPNQTCRPN